MYFADTFCRYEVTYIMYIVKRSAKSYTTPALFNHFTLSRGPQFYDKYSNCNTICSRARTINEQIKHNT